MNALPTTGLTLASQPVWKREGWAWGSDVRRMGKGQRQTALGRTQPPRLQRKT